MKLKNLLIFTAGVAVGVIAVKVFGKLSSGKGMKTEDAAEDDVWVANYSSDSMDISLWQREDDPLNLVFTPDELAEMYLWDSASGADYHNFEKSLADTQPVRVDETGAWELDE
jgi:hypothetical protein